MDNVCVPCDALLLNGHGLGAPFEYLINARYGISWGVMGALEDCVHRTREYALERPCAVPVCAEEACRRADRGHA